ncbi:unnamed protein product [Fraxinus pennsylvanica]|uniref:KIB1-4 beta-propeller domain-containing protein n=1 Tax=Fraxinus pennsylvanica TaxID=56036 RepID=A0AAD1ZE33_9LAMI|nr:unnamed protein product [Fraxinus pennsylvanica]
MVLKVNKDTEILKFSYLPQNTQNFRKILILYSLFQDMADWVELPLDILGYLIPWRILFSLVLFPEAIGRKCFGAGYGWLMTIGTDLQINLLHPFSRQQICLPPMLTFPVQYDYNDQFPPQDYYYFFVRKIVMSSNPGMKKSSPNYNPDCIVAAIYGENDILAFARLGESVWTNITVPSRSYDDIVCYSGKFYVVDCHGVVVVCDLDDDNDPKAIVVAPAPTKTRDSIRKYLVESAGDLCFSLEESRGEGNKYAHSLVELNTLGDQALFLGHNVSTSLSSSECKGTFKANCIYFTDDNFELYSLEPGGGGNDAGIFDMEKGTIELNYGRDFHSYTSPSLWFLKVADGKSWLLMAVQLLGGPARPNRELLYSDDRLQIVIGLQDEVYNCTEAVFSKEKENEERKKPKNGESREKVNMTADVEVNQLTGTGIVIGIMTERDRYQERSHERNGRGSHEETSCFGEDRRFSLQIHINHRALALMQQLQDIIAAEELEVK